MASQTSARTSAPPDDDLFPLDVAPAGFGMRPVAGRVASVVGLLLLGAVLAVLLPGVVPTLDLVYGAMTAALLAGALLTVRPRGRSAGSSLLIVPLIVAEAYFGAAALPAPVVATLLASLVHGGRLLTSLAIVGQNLVSFGVAFLVAAQTGSELWVQSVVFTVAFVVLRGGLDQLAVRLNVPPADDPRAERPDVLLSLLLAPLAALPLLVVGTLGTGALLAVLAALLAMLFVVREAVNLATARAEAEAERDRWARAHELQDELIHLITHEVKNPLTTVLAYSELGRDALNQEPPATATVDRHLVMIHRGGKAIERLVENLLQLSRYEGATELPPPEPVVVLALAAEVVADLEPLAEQKSQQLRVEVDEATPDAWAPPMLLREALSNLTSNAIKYTPEGGQITVWGRRDGEARKVVVGVTDTGVGLSEEDLQRLFTRFFRSGDPRVRRERGAGLGLALTRVIVVRMGGQIAVESVLDQGSTFRISLPPAPERG